MAFTEELLTELISCEKKKIKILKKMNNKIELFAISIFTLFLFLIGVVAITLF